MTFAVTFPLRTYSTLNQRVHWSVRAKRAKSEREATGFMVAKMPKNLPCTVRLVRLGAKALDGDNLQGAFKAVRDAIAQKLGADDADPRITWEYAQERAKGFAVRIELFHVEP